MSAARLARLCVLATLGLPSVGQAQALFDYTIRPGDTCRGIAERVYGDSDAYPHIHEHNPDMGPMPHHLTAGDVLRLPRPRPPARAGRGTPGATTRPRRSPG